MTGRNEAGAERQLRHDIDQDGLLDLHTGIMLLLSAALGWLGWRLMRHPGIFTAIVPMFLPASLGQLRRRHTCPRLGCPDYRPEAEKRFALIILTALALLGVVVFALTALFRTSLPGWFWRNTPAWLALGAAALFCLLAWWYGARRYIGYAAVTAAVVVVGYGLGLRTLLKLALLLLGVGAVLSAAGTWCFVRFRRHHPRPLLPPAEQGVAS